MHADSFDNDDWEGNVSITSSIRRNFPYLALTKVENFLGHCGHEKRLFDGDLGTASILLIPTGGVQCGRIVAER